MAQARTLCRPPDMPRAYRRLLGSLCEAIVMLLCASAGTGLDEEDVVDKKTREVDGRTVRPARLHVLHNPGLTAWETCVAQELFGTLWSLPGLH